MKRSSSKIQRRPVNGVFLLNKPLGISSNAALQKVRWLYRAEKAGHTGALDPLASGLLPICLGEATKFSHYLLDSTKRYQTTIQLGHSTTTGDVEGEILLQAEIPELDEERIRQVLAQFKGNIEQVPPMYSALKKEGRPLYELARKGIEIEREARPVSIYAIELLSFTAQSITLDITCSKGTYIRVLGEDIAQALGSYGHLTYLHRIKTGPFDLIPSYTIEYLESLNEAEREALLLPVYAPVDHFPKIQVPEGRSEYFSRGMESNIEHIAETQVLVFDGEKCLGLAEITDKKRLVPKRVLNL
ncbi:MULTISPECIES: tRNA pseudouridine(55) synthase TruB [Acinetobacter]|jgi:tRNA pseudouridine55 synthase|uniref:tRNA pseudouridine synthase B n=1 Tax=Acinetobacter radioresistens TaxID=40216 RepID=A0A8H2JWT8_ACIRA|nr:MULTISPECIES: tRNA pseudouridine(55) synthase TruB [Acinetobacter]EXB35676.1 tRNA pseudouridine(55) synthase [Acinetobacter sp. 1461402]MCM1934053.1 tRNA pseudouridine(55) synthase TruB [Acinetobacter radioresistens]MCM1951677.1 tRNA pseudouridine(55) synthase TruB [Acinetobacter radioresistens]MCU4307856.1 tRNA pseudouridine(55) synthase TruB [Acinetobacter radioresistens]MCU4498919.1 tRNA pseudouridine(55) synthase TruB [Acinetobacter radioresistens]